MTTKKRKCQDVLRCELLGRFRLSAPGTSTSKSKVMGTIHGHLTNHNHTWEYGSGIYHLRLVKPQKPPGKSSKLKFTTQNMEVSYGGYPQIIHLWIFYEMNHPAIGVPPHAYGNPLATHATSVPNSPWTNPSVGLLRPIRPSSSEWL